MQLRSLEAWALVAIGLGWLAFAADGGWLRLLLVGGVGTVVAGMGVSALLLPGDRRMSSYAALTCLAGAILAVLGLPFFGLAASLGLLASSTAGWLAAGRLSMDWTEETPGIPSEDGTLGLAARVAVDEALLGSFHLRIRFPTGDRLEPMARDAHDLLWRHRDRGHLEKPLGYHRTPLPLEAPRIESKSLFGIDYEHLRFDSEWEPEPDEPGRDRWLRGTANRTAHAYVVRGDPERPWLVGINGYRMGMAATDLPLFDPRYYHQRLGLNLLIPVLPLHGPRRVGPFSGDGYLDGDLVSLTYAESQAMWDIRRLVGWARSQGAPRVGVMGLSLGGYNTALLASVESDLACAVAGIPVCDFSRILARHAPPAFQLELERHGFDRNAVFDLLRPICPLAMSPQVAPEARAIFGGVADRIVPPEHQRDLIAHWETPRHVWYQGGHLTFRLDPSVRRLVHGVLVEHLGAASGTAARQLA